MAERERQTMTKEKKRQETEAFEELEKRSSRKKDLPEKSRRGRTRRYEDEDYDDEYDDDDDVPVRRRARHTFRHVCELIVIGLTYFQRSAIVRFLTTKLSMDVVVEVSARYGAPAGHRLSTFMAAIAADPRILALIITGIILIFNLLGWIIRKVSGRGY